MFHHNISLGNGVKWVDVEQPPPHGKVDWNTARLEFLHQEGRIRIHDLLGAGVDMDITELIQIAIQGTQAIILVTGIPSPQIRNPPQAITT